jgi:predicted RNA-binding Zn-ribbon protein involved in translation (DUF1610 family)
LREIARTYKDTEVVELAVKVKCPYCGNEWLETEKAECGETYLLECDKVDDGCGKMFTMYFDAS